MAVKLRLTRVGSKKNPVYRIVAADSRSPRDGKFLEIVGRYNPQTDPSMIELDEEKVRDWLSKGAQPSETVARLLKAKGISETCPPSWSSTWRAASSTSRTPCAWRRSSATATRPAAPRRQGRRRQGDRPPGPHRPRAAHGRARLGRAPQRADAARDRRVEARRCASPRSTTSTGSAGPRGRARGGRARGCRRDRVGGDIASGPPQPREVVELVALAAERALHPRQRRPPLRREFAGDEGLAWLLERLGDEQAQWLASLPFQVVARRHAVRARDAARRHDDRHRADDGRKARRRCCATSSSPAWSRATRTCSSSGGWGTSCSSTPAASAGRTRACRARTGRSSTTASSCGTRDYDRERAAELIAPLRPPAARRRSRPRTSSRRTRVRRPTEVFGG